LGRGWMPQVAQTRQALAGETGSPPPGRR
jgi:hypothetical protein